jgi:hypothetical protein
MPKKLKRLCDWKKEQLDDLDSYRDIVLDPQHVCKECGRVANKKKWLCKPAPLLKE